MAYFNVVCVVAGTGTLGLPYAFMQGGWMGLLIFFLSWAMSIYTGVLLVKALYGVPNRRISTFKELSTVCFGWIGGWFTFFLQCWILIGVPSLYMVLSGQNMHSLCQGTSAELNARYWTIICTVFVGLPFVLVKTMKEVAWASAIGSITTVIVVLIVLVVACIEQPSLPTPQHDAVIWPQFPSALATISFSFGGNVIYPNVELSMRHPRQWPKVLAIGLSSCAALYLLCAVPGYYIYGRDTMSPIYNNLPRNAAYMVAVVLITIHVLMAAPLLLTSLSLDLEEMLRLNRFGNTKEALVRSTLRIVILGIVMIIAIFLPYFDLLMELVGSVSNCTLIFLLPIFTYLKLTGVRNKPIYELAWMALIVVFGLVGLIFGTKGAIEALIVRVGQGVPS
ncbi:transmembrane amino acid transporter protein-domain-containing protein [Gongronella butleri]|nr:transmembrane amino acid transporter protein-domain-containing protein [Gongronella butleri]